MASKKYKKVAVGGTFDKFHQGHRSLLEEAFRIGDEIIIGVTSDEFGGKKGDVESCDTRMSNLNEFLSTIYPQKFHIKRLEDPFGTTIHEADFEAIVVSQETEPTAVNINEIRTKKGMDPMDIVVIETVFAEDGRPISSTRIRKGEIDRKGHLLKKLRSVFK
ncbi:MAG: phosphopantetheine adenylyltransferase [Methanobacterium sp.]|nr:MAG: phosphopantetheine adenylyltransferase [Methanobacterium sp.]